MRFTAETSSDGVSERPFTLDDVTGILWTPAEAVGGRPLVLLGHGGSRHKRTPGMLAYAHRYVTACGFAVAAIDAPGHGDRPRSARDEAFAADLLARFADGQPIDEQLALYYGELSEKAVPEWRAVLDALQRLDQVGPDRPVGYWGVSMGTGVGIPLAAAEPRITAAVFGLVGHRNLYETAAKIEIPVEFLVQWDDELTPREEAFELFEALGSAEKTLHANPGGHTDLPEHELDSSERFFARHLARP